MRICSLVFLYSYNQKYFCTIPIPYLNLCKILKLCEQMKQSRRISKAEVLIFVGGINHKTLEIISGSL